jgi:hypothetical protein
VDAQAVAQHLRHLLDALVGVGSEASPAKPTAGDREEAAVRRIRATS